MIRDVTLPYKALWPKTTLYNIISNGVIFESVKITHR